MIATKCYKYRILPNAEQEARFRQFAGCRRFVWNWALNRKQAHFKATGKSIGYNALAGELVALKKQPETAFLKECQSQVLQQTLMDLDKAFGAFFEKRARLPKFKSLKRTPHAFRFPQCAKIEGQSVRLPVIGTVKAIIHREAEGVVKSATVKQEANGAWYAVFVAHVELPDMLVSSDNPVGIDVGLESFVTLSTGEKVKPPKFYRSAERKLKRLSRQLVRCKAGGNRRAKAKQRLAKHHGKTAARRNDWLHKLSTRIIREHDTVSVEDLNIKGLVKTKLGKSFHDAALGSFLRQLEYKARWNGVQFVKVGRFFASSKTCFACGSKQVLTLSERQWECQSCGATHDRDGNASMNILAEGLRILAACRDSLK